MRAVNLIPRDARAASAAGRSGGAAYAVLAVLAALVVMAGAWTYLGSTERAKRDDAARVGAQATAVEAQANSLKTYTDLAKLSQARTETIRQLATSRFDWPHALREVARTMPAGTWLTSLRATVAPNVSVDGTADPLRAALVLPAIELAGCATTQDDVARSVVAMRRMDAVKRVSLSSSTAQDDASGAGPCGENAPANAPQFSMTVFFDAPATSAASTTAGAPDPTGTATTASATTGGTTP